MTRQTSPIEVKSWVSGLVTEASPLTYPENASIEEDNFILNTDGTRQRRLGIDFELESANITTSITSSTAPINLFNWKNVAGDASKEFIVVQVGNEVTILDQTDILAYNIMHVKLFDTSLVNTRFTFTSIDGMLVVATGEADVSVLEYVNDATWNWTTSRIKVRDLFGIEDNWNNFDLKAGDEVSTRPAELTDAHNYNLRNQTWGISRRTSGALVMDPIKSFNLYGGSLTVPSSLYPSNADQVTQALYADTDDASNRTVDRFHPADVWDNPIGNFAAASGHFIIDLLERGASRVTAISRMNDKYDLDYPITSLPVDKTPGGATVVGEFAGRVWYGGFSGEVIGGDSKSPRLASYVLFSKAVKDPSDLTQCYQTGDPTSKEAPDIVDTDGGYIRLDGAYGIRSLVNVGKGLLVIAANGVWMVMGGDTGFKATNYIVDKITDRGIVGDNTVVVVDGSVMFWGNDGIYQVKANQYGEWSATNVTDKVIKRFYEEIPTASKVTARGIYDVYERKVRWIYDNDRNSLTTLTKELVIDVALGAFYTNTIHNPTAGMAKVVASVTTLPFQANEVKSEVKYLAITYTSPIKFRFALFSNEDFEDWGSTGYGVDARAHMLTGYIAGGDFQRQKGVPSITFHSMATEKGWTQDELGYLHPIRPSSCKVRIQWNWTNSEVSGKWSREFQVYRRARLFLPTGPSDSYGDGLDVISSRTSIRGSGRVLAILVSTEPKMDCHLVGWSMVLGMNTNV